MTTSAVPAPPLVSRADLLAELQALGIDGAPAGGAVAPARRGGAGPSDHRAVSLGASTVMVPLRTAGASPFRLRVLDDAPTSTPGARALLLRDGAPVGEVQLPATPRFYALSTADGIPYSKIALLHSHNVLASTVMQNCVRYADPEQACRFCSIGSSLEDGRALPRKSPAQLAEVAEAAVRLDGVEQLVLTTGTPATPDRGAAHLAAIVRAVKAAVPSLPIQVQCEPPDDLTWIDRLREAGADALGMHLEAVEPAVRARVMPGKNEVPLARYFEAFAAAVRAFGRGQVSTYLIAGLGDQPASLIEMAERLIGMGVYPFVVPFVPIAGTPMAEYARPPADTMHALYRQVGALLNASGLHSADMKAGCAKCGACSALAAYEARS